jgi:hypothetical protein
MNRCRALLADLAFKVPYKSYVSATGIATPVLGERLAHRQRSRVTHFLRPLFQLFHIL